MKKEDQPKEQTLNARIYITISKRFYVIKQMSKGFIKNQINYIKHTQLNIEYLPILEKELNKREILTFKLLK